MNEFDQRVAFMAIAQIPFIVGLVGKNNVISYLTGVSHEKVRCLSFIFVCTATHTHQ
jgi:ferric-chelate reductase